MKKQHNSQTTKTVNKKVNFKFDPKDDSLLNIKMTTPKGNNINLNFIANPKKPDIEIKVDE